MRILWVSNAIWVQSGYGVQAAHVLPRLRELGHEVAQAAWYGLHGGRIEYDGIPVYPQHQDILGRDVMLQHARHFEADLMITLMDIWPLPMDFVRQIAENDVAWAPWFPVDTEPASPLVVDRARLADYPIVYSWHGHEAMAAEGVPCAYIPHGINTEVFRPGDKAAAREKLGHDEDAYIVLMVAANKGYPSRKAFAENLEAFARFKQDCPQAVLHLHTDITPVGDKGVDFRKLVPALGLTFEDVKITDEYQRLLGLSEDFMATLYQAADVLLAASMSEGFGIPIVEAQACGCPAVTTHWASMPELTLNGVCTLPLQRFWTPTGSWYCVPDIDAIADALRELYARSDHEREVDSALGAEHMRRMYGWDNVVGTYWRPFLDSVEAAPGESNQATEDLHLGVRPDGNVAEPHPYWRTPAERYEFFERLLNEGGTPI